MTSLLLIAALTAPPVELHTVPRTAAGAQLRACLTCDIPAVCEDTRAIQHYQHELRRIVSCQDSLDDFLVVGRNRVRLPEYRHPCIVVLFIQREINLHNASRKYAETTADYEVAKQLGMVDLGSEEFTETVLPQPWESGYQLTTFVPPGVGE